MFYVTDVALVGDVYDLLALLQFFPDALAEFERFQIVDIEDEKNCICPADVILVLLENVINRAWSLLLQLLGTQEIPNLVFVHKLLANNPLREDMPIFIRRLRHAYRLALVEVHIP